MPNRYILLIFIGIFVSNVYGQCESKLKDCMSIVDDCEILIDNYKKLIDLKNTDIKNVEKQLENYSDMYKNCEISLDVERTEFNYLIKKERRNRKLWQIISFVGFGSTISVLTYAILK